MGFDDIIARLRRDDASLKQLHFSRDYIDGVKLRALADALKKNRTLTVLILRDCLMGDAEAESLAEVLKSNNTLTHLDLSSNILSNAGAKSVADALEVNHAITFLDLSANEIGETGAHALAESLKRNRVLTHLCVIEAHISAVGVQALSRALPFTNCRILIDLEFENNNEIPRHVGQWRVLDFLGADNNDNNNDTAAGRFLRRDGDRALVLRVLAFLTGCNF